VKCGVRLGCGFRGEVTERIEDRMEMYCLRLERVCRSCTMNFDMHRTLQGLM